METKLPQRTPVNIEDQMRESYMDYAMSVIIGRALPDARDGLKPVHRRILYAMFREGLLHNRRYSKCAGVVGEVLKRYHPHGDSAVYDALVRLAQEWNVRYPLIDGQGNFGSVDGDPPAAYRYTECRLTALAEELLADIERDTVDFVPNFDDSTQEPFVLPSRVPNLLVNGSSGIAVGMATNVPPHNLGEVCDALVALIDNPDLTVDDLMRYIPGPDFPTAGFICGQAPVREAYHEGRGILAVRARAEIETDEKSGRSAIIVTEIPYQVNKARLVERIAELVNERKLDGISDLRDESDRDGMRVVIELKRDAVPEVLLNQLYKHTPMQESFGVNMLAIVEGRPRLLTLKDALRVFLDHRRNVVARRTAYDLRQAEARLHILAGLKTAIDHLDEAIAIIRGAADPATARAGLMAGFALSELQAQAILEMRLQRLTSLERDKIVEEYAETEKAIQRYRAILADEREIWKIITEELRELRAKYADPRRTQLVPEAAAISVEDLIVEEDMVVTISHEGYIKRNAVALYRAQRRGGRGKIGATTRDEDFVEHLFVASTHSYLLFFTTTGKVYWLKVHEIPQAGRAARGRSITNVLSLRPEEKLSAFLPVREFQEGRYVLFATRRGHVKKTDLMQYASPRPSGIIAIALEDADEVIGVRLTDGAREAILSTRDGQAIRFREEEARPMGRDTHGVRGMKLDEGDEVVALDLVEPGATLLAVAENGYGKRTEMGEYRLTRRGGKGIITMKTTDKTGRVTGVRMVTDDDQIMLVTSGGKVIRLRVNEIRVIGRNTQGVRLIGLEEGERVVSVARLAEREDESEVKDEAPPPEPSSES
ncbi:MAG: DNA gyrase subunit A [Deltaproteobacteria bacterium]|nr:MAG: DNA gyrase subunit A [Deltaproteobacteria bacterium]TMB15485.1 MAG: DNA gyrase subunit A [Deltaproteobacteria bacterium]